jgi:hypothetical protein
VIPVYVPGTRVSRAVLLLAAFVACTDGICQSDNGEATVPENVIVRGTIVSKVDASDTILRSTLLPTQGHCTYCCAVL